MNPRSPDLRRLLLLFLCLLLAFAAAVSVVDSIDGDNDGVPDDAFSVLPLALCALPPPTESATLHAPVPHAAAPRPPAIPRHSLRAPPGR